MLVVKEFFDVVIIGNSLPSLIAGALLSRKGLRALVLGQKKEAEEDSRAFFNTLGNKLAGSIFDTLGISHLVKRKSFRPSPLFQVVLGDKRLDVTTDHEIFFEELKREFSISSGRLKELIDNLPLYTEKMENLIESGRLLPSDGYIERKWTEFFLKDTIFGKLNEEFIKTNFAFSTPFSSFIKAVSATNSFIETEQLNPAIQLLLFKRKMSGYIQFEGGQQRLFQILHDKISTYGGEIRVDSEPEEILLEGKIARAIRLTGKESLTGFDYLVVGTNTESISPLLKKDGRTPKTQLLQKSDIEPSLLLTSSRVTLKKEAIPLPMASSIIVVFDPQKKLEGSNFVWINLKDEIDGDLVQMELNYFINRGRVIDSPSYSLKVREKIFSNLNTLIPLFSEYVTSYIDPIEEIIKSPYLENPSFQILKMSSPMFKLKNVNGINLLCGSGLLTTIKNILKANNEVYPSLGEDGLILSAIGVAKKIARVKKGIIYPKRRKIFP